MANAAQYDVVQREGADLLFTVELFDDGSRVDLTGKTVSTHIAYSPDPDADAAPTQFVVAVVDAPQGILTITLPAASNNTPGRFAWRMDLHDGARIEPLLYGSLTVQEAYDG